MTSIKCNDINYFEKGNSQLNGIHFNTSWWGSEVGVGVNGMLQSRMNGPNVYITAEQWGGPINLSCEEL